MDSIAILRLYTNVLRDDVVRNQIIEPNIRAGVQDMARVYAPEIRSLQKDITDRPCTDFNNVAFRCAYLHKYAPLHTYIVLDVMLRILKQELPLFQRLLSSGRFKFCCLGGGPGSDAIGLLVALHVAFDNFKSSATIIDKMKNWEDTFSSIMLELRYGEYGIKWSTLHKNFQWSYIESDLLLNMTSEANAAIAAASFITMVKFISAASCTQTEPMVEKIFRAMKPEALVLFIDNAAGGFTELIVRVGEKNGFKLIFSVRHALYTNEDLKITRFGYSSCSETRVTVILMQKPNTVKKQKKQPLLRTGSANQNTTASIMNKPFQSASYITEASPERRAHALLSVTNLQQQKKQSHPQSLSSSQNTTSANVENFFQPVIPPNILTNIFQPNINETTPSISSSNLPEQNKPPLPRSLSSSQNTTSSNVKKYSSLVIQPNILSNSFQPNINETRPSISSSNLLEQNKQSHPRSLSSCQNTTASNVKKYSSLVIQPNILSNSFQPNINETSSQRHDEATSSISGNDLQQQKRPSRPRSSSPSENATAYKSFQPTTNINEISPGRRNEATSSIRNNTQSPVRTANNRSPGKSTQRVGSPVSNQHTTREKKESNLNRSFPLPHTGTVSPSTIVQVHPGRDDTVQSYQSSAYREPRVDDSDDDCCSRCAIS